MSAIANQLADSRESLEIGLLGRQERRRSEMRQHVCYQITDVPHFELERLVRSVRSDEPAFPFLSYYVEQFGSLRVLADREARSHLPTESMTIARLKRNAETTLTVHETGDVGVDVHRQGSGPASYGLSAIQEFSHS